MKNDLFIKNGIIIPYHELEITTSRAGGPGGQHVNKTDTRITIRWNTNATQALNDEQKKYLLEKLNQRITNDGDLVVHNSESRSQFQNKKNALRSLTEEIRNALYIAKTRIPTKISQGLKEKRLQKKTRRSAIKKMRSKKIKDD